MSDLIKTLKKHIEDKRAEDIYGVQDIRNGYGEIDGVATYTGTNPMTDPELQDAVDTACEACYLMLDDTPCPEPLPALNAGMHEPAVRMLLARMHEKNVLIKKLKHDIAVLAIEAREKDAEIEALTLDRDYYKSEATYGPFGGPPQ